MSWKRQEVRIRMARPDELARAGDVAVRAFSRLRCLLTDENWLVMERVIRFTTAEDQLGCLFVADWQGQIVGSVRYTGPGHGGHKIYPDSFAYIRAVAVSPDHSRHGIGRQLTEKCIEIAQQDAAEAVGLHVARENDAARALYARLGFKFYREAPDYFGLPYEAFFIRF